MAEEKSVFTKIIDWLKKAAEWVEENLGDPALAEVLRADLGLAPGESVPKADRDQLKAFADGMDPDNEAFDATVAEITDAIDMLVQIGETLKADDLTGWDVAWLLGRVMTAETIRVRWPILYAAGKLAEFVSDDPESFEEFDPAVVMDLLQGEAPPVAGEVLLQRINALTWLVVTAAEHTGKHFGVDFVSAYSGWDPDPASTTPNADLVSARATTLLIGPPGDLSAQLTMTVLGVPPEHQGPGVFVSFGGGINVEHEDGDTTYRFKAGATGALDLFVPLGSPMPFTVGGDPSGFVRFDVVRSKPDGPAVRIGDPTGTRLDVGKLALGVDIGPGRAAVRMGFEKAELVIVLGEGDGFLAQLPGGEIRIELGLIVNVDSVNGLTIEGGTRARATLPIDSSLFGVFTIHHVEIALGPSPNGRDAALELSGGFGLNLGPFKASVDRLGLLLDIGFQEGNLGFVDVEFGFKPPNGVGLVLDAGAVKGGGYLFVDVDRGEYAGALELRFLGVGVKALGILSTRLPDGTPSDSWSLLLLIYGQFPPIQLSWGFTLTGVGGIIGIHHGVSIDALQSGLSTGVLDDILFPADPVADAPRIINRLRAVFPVTPRALTFGPMLEIGWGTPNIVTIRLGVIIQLDNAIGPGAGSLEFTRLVLVGQLLAQMPPKELGAPPLLKLLVDVLGYYDAAEQRLGFQARLRDSKVAGLTLTGMLIVQADFGDEPTFVLAAGGFHPKFKDLPAGLPAKIDRLGVKFDISIVKVTLEGYFAVTPATVQAGASILVKATLGPVGLEGWLSFDVIFFFEPRFHFEADLKAGVRVKFKGRTLASVQLTMTLTGPGLWRATGEISFSILFWDVSKSFDESIGSAPATPTLSTNVSSLVQAAISDEGNWSAQLPPSGVSVVSIGPIAGVTGLLAHPLGQLQLVQNVAPLGVDLQKFGTTTIEGPKRFDITEVRVGAQALADPPTVAQAFARSHFVEMSEEEKLSRPSFERFDAGVAVGTDAFTPAPTQIAANLEYETHILHPPGEDGPAVLEGIDLLHIRVAVDDLRWQATLGASARAEIRRSDQLVPSGAVRVSVQPPPLAVADATTMAETVTLTGAAVQNTVLAGASLAGTIGSQLVEAFEVSQ